MPGGGRDRTGLLLAGAGSRDTEEVVPAAAGSGARDPKARYHSFPGCGEGYCGSHDGGARGGDRRCDSLLFLFAGDGAGICKAWISYRTWRCGDFLKMRKRRKKLHDRFLLSAFCWKQTVRTWHRHRFAENATIPRISIMWHRKSQI